jgi:hypothetical protein
MKNGARATRHSVHAPGPQLWHSVVGLPPVQLPAPQAARRQLLSCVQLQRQAPPLSERPLGGQQPGHRYAQMMWLQRWTARARTGLVVAQTAEAQGALLWTQREGLRRPGARCSLCSVLRPSVIHPLGSCSQLWARPVATLLPKAQCCAVCWRTSRARCHAESAATGTAQREVRLGSNHRCR